MGRVSKRASLLSSGITIPQHRRFTTLPQVLISWGGGYPPLAVGMMLIASTPGDQHFRGGSEYPQAVSQADRISIMIPKSSFAMTERSEALP